MLGLGWPLADEVIAITLARANGAEEGDRGAVILRHIRYGNRLLVDIHADEECARLGHGGPPTFQMMFRHQAALAWGKRTRVTSGVNLPPLEVIMSRCQRLRDVRSI
jgi:hypothetical protein